MTRLLHRAVVAGLLTLCASAVMAGASPRADASGVPPLPSLDAQQQRGHAIAVRRCSGCHTVGLDDGGAREGPVFYRLARRYDPKSLERRFAEVSAHGVDSMPPVSLTATEAAELSAYFASLVGE